MRILMLVFNMSGHGTWYRAYEFARHLVQRGHTVTLVSTSPHAHFQRSTRVQDGITLVEMPDLFSGSLRSGWDPFNVLARMQLVNRLEFEVVHAFESRPTVILPALRASRRGIPLVLDWADWFGRGGSVEERPNPLLRTLLRGPETFFEEHYRGRADATTVICETLRERAVALGVAPDSIALLRNGFDIPGWTHYSRAEARRRLSIPPGEHLVGYVGSLFPGDARLMAEAFNQLAQRMPRCRLVHAGQSRYSPRAWLEDPGSLIETGTLALDGMSLHLAACDVCWLPFRDTPANRGRFPMKFSNYLAAGRAVVATRVGDPAQIIKRIKNGLVTGEDPVALAEAVVRVIANRGEREEMERASLALGVEPKESWRARAQALEKWYRRAGALAYER